MSKLKEELDLILAQSFDYGDLHQAPNELIRVPASVLCLFAGENFARSDVLLIKRSTTVATHVSQIAFPGGGMEDLDQADPLRTALRETREEVGLGPEGILVSGILPGFPTVTGDYWVTPVLALGSEPIRNQPFTLDHRESETAEWVSVEVLQNSRFLERRMVRGVERELPVFKWGEDRMWGLTALIFDLILHRYAKLNLC